MIIDFQLNEKRDAEKLNQIAQKYTYDIWVQHEDRMFDAKTLLALYTLPTQTPLQIVLEDNIDAKLLRKDLETLQSLKKPL